MREAKAPTALEFADDVIGTCMGLARQVELDPQFARWFPSGRRMMYSFDNAPIHTAALQRSDVYGEPMVQRYGFDEKKDRLQLSPFSPDMHRVIEHTHGTATYEFQKWLMQNRGKLSVQEYKDAFETIYRRVVTATSVRKDVQGLPTLYKWVATHGGSWPPAHMR
jgi:hypothetical protein